MKREQQEAETRKAAEAIACAAVVLKDIILEIADNLYHDCQMSEYDHEHRDPVRIKKYIQMTWPE